MTSQAIRLDAINRTNLNDDDAECCFSHIGLENKNMSGSWLVTLRPKISQAIN